MLARGRASLLLGCLNFCSKSFATWVNHNPVRVSPTRSIPRLVPSEIARPPYICAGIYHVNAGPIEIKPKADIERMKRACQIASAVREIAGEHCKPGVTTDEIDLVVHDAIVNRFKAYPSPLGYQGFPKSVCTSLNEVVCHGIPDSRPLEDGDIVNIDCSVFADGFHGDCSATFLVGEVDEEGKKLVRACEESLRRAIKVCAPGTPFSLIGHVISDYVESHKFGVVREYMGHGIGRHFHMQPYVIHTRNADHVEMKEGMVFTIEPPITEGATRNEVLENNWTVVTSDRLRSAQWEETIAITETGAEVLTQHRGSGRLKLEEG